MNSLEKIDSQIAALEKKIAKAKNAKSELESILFELDMGNSGYVWGRAGYKKMNSGSQRTSYRFQKAEDVLVREYRNRKTAKGNTFESLYNRVWIAVNS